jgi:outer membrane protein TolC
VTTRLSTVVLPAVVLFSAALSGCSVARHPYVQPAPATPHDWSRDAGTAGPIDPDRLGRWWESFGDPVLSQVLQQIAAGNLDVKTALSHVREARAQVVIARSNRMPTITAGFSATASHPSKEAGVVIESQKDVQQSYTLDADASWELDVLASVAPEWTRLPPRPPRCRSMWKMC